MARCFAPTAAWSDASAADQILLFPLERAITEKEISHEENNRLAPYFAAKAAMDSLAVSYAAELARWGVQTTIVVPGAFTKGTRMAARSSTALPIGYELSCSEISVFRIF
jgi:NAD(P)-dependent dehydrogenase (short-subunit alcohol dehydrogenase family)